MKNLDIFDWVALVLLVIGGLNWGLIGVFNIDLVSLIFGYMTTLTRVVYGLVGASALYSLYTLSTKTEQELFIYQTTKQKPERVFVLRRWVHSRYS